MSFEIIRVVVPLIVLVAAAVVLLVAFRQPSPDGYPAENDDGGKDFR